jgi:hypothetical protein
VTGIALVSMDAADRTPASFLRSALPLKPCNRTRPARAPCRGRCNSPQARPTNESLARNDAILGGEHATQDARSSSGPKRPSSTVLPSIFRRMSIRPCRCAVILIPDARLTHRAIDSRSIWPNARVLNYARAIYAGPARRHGAQFVLHAKAPRHHRRLEARPPSPAR